MRVQVYLIRGSEVNFDCDEVQLTPDTVVVYGQLREGIDLKKPVIGEFYRDAIAGYKRTDL